MKKIIAVTALMVVGLGAGLRAADDTVDVTFDATYVTKYIFRGIVLAKDGFQPSIEGAYKDYYAGIWGNVSLNNRRQFPDSEEWDFYAGKNFAVTDVASVDAGYTLFYYPELTTDSSTNEIYIGVNFDVQGFTPAIYNYYDFNRRAWTVQGSVGTSIPLQAIGASIDLNTALGRVESDFEVDYTYWSAGVAIPYKLSDNTTVTAGATFATHGIRGLNDNNFAFTFSITGKF